MNHQASNDPPRHVGQLHCGHKITEPNISSNRQKSGTRYP